MKQVIVDPTDERVPIRRTLALRSGQIRGRVAMLDIAKPRGDVRRRIAEESDFVIEALAD